MKTEIRCFAAARIGDASALFSGFFSREEIAFSLTDAAAWLAGLLRSSEAVIRTSFAGTPAEFSEFCGGYAETENRICLIRSPRNLLLNDLPGIYERSFEKCQPDTGIFNVPCSRPEVSDLAVIWFRKANCSCFLTENDSNV